MNHYFLSVTRFILNCVTFIKYPQRSTHILHLNSCHVLYMHVLQRLQNIEKKYFSRLVRSALISAVTERVNSNSGDVGWEPETGDGIKHWPGPDMISNSTIYRGPTIISIVEISFRFQLYLTSIIPLCHYRNDRSPTCN